MKPLRIFLCLLSLAIVATSTRAQNQEPQYKPIDEATLAAYRKIGMVFAGQHRGEVATICFDGTRALDLRHRFPDVDVPFGLHFSQFAKMTDAGMKQLAHLKNLTYLRLASGIPVTDAGLKELAGLKKLRRLELENAKIGDTTLRTLREMGLLHALVGGNFNPVDTERRDRRNYWENAADVKRFALTTTRVTDVGVKELVVFKNLENLNLAATAVTGTGLKDLVKLKKLSVLTMSRATDEGLKGVASLRNLTSLTIASVNESPELQAALTDAGLKELACLTKLTELRLLDCPRITDAGIAALRRALPTCKITRR